MVCVRVHQPLGGQQCQLTHLMSGHKLAATKAPRTSPCFKCSSEEEAGCTAVSAQFSGKNLSVKSVPP